MGLFKPRTCGCCATSRGGVGCMAASLFLAPLVQGVEALRWAAGRSVPWCCQALALAVGRACSQHLWCVHVPTVAKLLATTLLFGSPLVLSVAGRGWAWYTAQGFLSFGLNAALPLYVLHSVNQLPAYCYFRLRWLCAALMRCFVAAVYGCTKILQGTRKEYSVCVWHCLVWCGINAVYSPWAV